MGKRTRLSRQFQQQKKGGSDFEDRISNLPDEIIFHIFSFLKLKEAAITGVLSRRWRYLWLHTRCLDFDGSDILGKLDSRPELLEIEVVKYVNWLNDVVRMHEHEGLALKEFRVRFDLDARSKCHIDKWVQFAFSKSIQRFELDLSDNVGWPTYPSYCWPNKLYFGTGSSLNEPRSEIFTTQLYTFDGFKSLKSMSLKNVSVSGEDVESFLSHCPLLERLTLESANNLVNLKVAGPSLMLKHLEIHHCLNIIKVEISNTNIISFKYSGGTVGLFLYNAPMLVELSFVGRRCDTLHYIFAMVRWCFSQLETLTLGLPIWRSNLDVGLDLLPEFNRLKHLVLQVPVLGDDRLLELTRFIWAAPCLQLLTVQFIWVKPVKSHRKVDKSIATRSHPCLKVVEMVGYYGRSSDLELAMFFIQSAIALERLVINPHPVLIGTIPAGPNTLMKVRTARQCAKRQLKGKMPQGVELIVL